MSMKNLDSLLDKMTERYKQAVANVSESKKRVAALEAEIAALKATLAQVNEELQRHIGVLAGSQPLASQVVELKKELAKERVAFARKAAEHSPLVRKDYGIDCSCGWKMPLIDSRPTSLLWQEHIPTLAQSDLSALVERDRETRERALEDWLEFAASRGWDGAIAITKRDFAAFLAKKGGSR